MTGSATDDRKSRRTTNQTADKVGGATTGLMLVALLHAGALAWVIGLPGAFPAPMRLPFGASMASTGTSALLAIFLIAAFARRQALAFVIVPIMIVAGVCTHAASDVGDRSPTPLVMAGVLGFGEAVVSICLSFAASAIAARVGVSWGKLRLGQSPAFRLGALSLVLVLAVATVSEQMAPLAGLCAAVSVTVLGTLVDAVDRDTIPGGSMPELVSALALSLGAIWIASLLAGTSSAATSPANWEAARTAMRFAWFAAMPLVLAALVALLPRIKATGIGVKRHKSTVLATTIGVVTCIGVSQAMLVRATPSFAATPELPSNTHTSTALTPAPIPPPAPVKPALAPSIASPASSSPTPDDSAPAVLPAGDPAASDLDVVVEPREAGHSIVSAKVKVNGPMLTRDVRQGVAKSFRALSKCYEQSDIKGQPYDLRVELLIDDVGSVKQAEPIKPSDPKAKHLTCMALAFYRSGFSSPAKLTWLEVDLAFRPKP